MIPKSLEQQAAEYYQDLFKQERAKNERLSAENSKLRSMIEENMCVRDEFQDWDDYEPLTADDGQNQKATYEDGFEDGRLAGAVLSTAANGHEPMCALVIHGGDVPLYGLKCTCHLFTVSTGQDSTFVQDTQTKAKTTTNVVDSTKDSGTV